MGVGALETHPDPSACEMVFGPKNTVIGITRSWILLTSWFTVCVQTMNTLVRLKLGLNQLF